MHVLLLPGLLLALITVHLFLVVYHKHTQWAGPGRTEQQRGRLPVVPGVHGQGRRLTSSSVFGVTALMGALMQINPVWLYGPYNPAEVTAGSQPDWYMGWLEGSVRIFPGFESHFWGITLSWNLIIPALIIPPAFVTLVALYPFIEGWITGDKREHHLLDRPRDIPTRTGIGAAFITFYGLLWIGGGNDLVATHFGVSLNHVTWFLRFAVILGPVIAFWITRRWVAISLQARRQDRLLHGLETGIIVALPRRRVHREAQPISIYEAYSLTARDRLMPYELGAGHRRQRRPRPAPGPQQGPRHPVPVLRLTRTEGVPIASAMGTPSGVMDSGGRAVRKDPVRAGEVAGVAGRVRDQVVLVLRLSLPERRLRLDRGHSLAGPQP